MLLSVKEINTFYGLAHILYDISLSVGEGETVCLLGRNGAGKTTTIRSILGLTPPTSGTIMYKGEPIHGLRNYIIANKGIGYVPAERRIFPNLTVEQNLIVGFREAGKQRGWDMEKVYSHFPSLSSMKKRKGWNLSGGEQQMLAIARTLMLNPALVLVDEPTEGLAPLIVREVVKILEELRKEKISILLVEQNAHIALNLSSRCYALSDGHLIYERASKEISKDQELMKKLFGVF